MDSGKSYKISTGTGVAIVMANMIGTGVFTSLGFQVKDMENPVSILILWLLGGLLALAGAFSYAEVGTTIRKSGGEYVFLSSIYHPIIGYLSGWISLTVGFAAPIALAAIGVAKYLQVEPLYQMTVAISVVAIISFIHTQNLRISSRFQVLSTVFKVSVMVILILAGLAISGYEEPNIELSHQVFLEINSSAFAIALIYVTYSYSGWNAAAYITEEFRNPLKSLPIALIGGTVLVTMLYTLLQFVFLKHIPFSELLGKVEVGQLAAMNMFGSAYGKVFSFVIAMLLVSSISAMVWVGPRVTSSMANRHPFWNYFSVGKDKIPKKALWLQFIISAVLIITGTFEQIMVYCGVLLSVSSMLVIFAVFILRYKNHDKSVPVFKSPIFPFFQLVYLFSMFWMIGFTLVEYQQEVLLGLLNLIVGLLTYFISKRLEIKR